MRAEKKFLVDEVASQLASSNYLLIANFTGVTVKDATAVRDQLRAHGAEYHVVRIAFLISLRRKLNFLISLITYPVTRP